MNAKSSLPIEGVGSVSTRSRPTTAVAAAIACDAGFADACQLAAR